MKKKNNYENQLALIQEDNINVSTTNEGKDFLILLSGIVGIVLAFLFSFSFLSSIYIDRMPVETQLKIESLFSVKQHIKTDNKYNKKIAQLNHLKKLVIRSVLIWGSRNSVLHLMVK